MNRPIRNCGRRMLRAAGGFCILMLICLPGVAGAGVPRGPQLQSERAQTAVSAALQGPKRFSRQRLTSAPKDSARVDSSRVKNPTGAMIRSALIPGWGQWYNGKKLKAVLVAAVELGLVANAVRLNQKVVASRSETERSFWQDQRNLQFWLLLATKLLSMLDAYVDAHLSDFDESPLVRYTPAATGVRWAVSLPLP